MKNNFTMPFTESGITLNFPDNNYFCFENCRGYQKLSGFHFKEMDACWIDLTNNILYAIELKDYSQANVFQDSTAKVWDLVKKSIDTLSMFLAIMKNTKHSSELSTCLPSNIDINDFQIKFVHIINTLPNQRTEIQFLQDDFRQKTKAYQKLFSYTFTILTYQQAKKRFPSIIL